MKKRARVASALAVSMLLTDDASAAELERVGTIQIPGEALTSFDIGFVDQAQGRYYLADRSNKAIDIIDAGTDRYLGRAGRFVGAVTKDGKVLNDVSGPDGVVTVGQQIWAGDGDSTIQIIDPATRTATAAISTGGKTRLDEVAFDPADQVFIGVNNAENPPFATLMSTKPGHAILGKIAFTGATDGAEQPAYNREDGMFYMAIPELDGDPHKGGSRSSSRARAG